MAVEILDGPIGTELILRGLTLEGLDWSARAVNEAPTLLAEVHADYARAGAMLHTANTFRTQPRVLGDRWRDALEAARRQFTEDATELAALDTFARNLGVVP